MSLGSPRSYAAFWPSVDRFESETVSRANQLRLLTGFSAPSAAAYFLYAAVRVPLQYQVSTKLGGRSTWACRHTCLRRRARMRSCSPSYRLKADASSHLNELVAFLGLPTNRWSSSSACHTPLLSGALLRLNPQKTGAVSQLDRGWSQARNSASTCRCSSGSRSNASPACGDLRAGPQTRGACGERGDPLARHRARAEPQPEPEEVPEQRVQDESAMGLIALKMQRHAERHQLDQGERERGVAHRGRRTTP